MRLCHFASPFYDGNSTTLPFGDFLSSTDSVAAVAVLFARVDSTTKSSEFPTAFMPTLPSERFVGRSRSDPPCGFAPEADGTLPPRFQENAGAFGMSTHAQGLRLRRVRRCLAINGSDDVAFPLSRQDRHTKVVMSEFNGWPALPFARTLKTARSPGPPLR